MRILLAHDGSNGARAAADLVRSVPWPDSSIVRVISVIEPTTVPLTPWAGGAAGYSAELDSQINAYYKEELTAAVERLERPNYTVESVLVRGRPGTAIVDQARAFDGDIVVVGS